MAEVSAVAPVTRAQVPAETPQATSLLGALVAAARDPSTDITKMERLFAMHKEMAAIQAETAFNDAMARVQGKLQPIRKNRENTHTRSKYATLAALQQVINPILAAEGLTLTFHTDASPITNHIRVIGTIAHGAFSKQRPLDVPLDKAGSAGTTNKTDMQAGGSSLTYAMRYLTKMILGLSEAEDDKDGNAPRESVALLTHDHQLTIESKCDEVEKDKMLVRVLKSYKAKSLAEIADAEYARIIERIEKYAAAAKP